MPKYGFMISKAVDIVAKKLAGMDSETVARLTNILSEEAQMISEELQNSGEKVNADVLAARLEGVVARMKYEVRNQGPDPSPHEFPIFNVSHNPSSPYPNPINHLYDKRYKEAYSTFIKPNSPTTSTTQKPEPSSPSTPSPAPSKPTTNSNSSSYSTPSQGQQQSSKPSASYPPGYVPSSPGQQATNWQYMNPYASMTPAQIAYYQQLQQQQLLLQQQQQQQASKLPPSTQDQSSSSSARGVRHSSTSEDIRSHPLSRSTSNNELNYSTNSGKEKIRVRVIHDNSTSSTTDPQTNSYSNNGYQTQRSILKPTNEGNNNQEKIPPRTVYTSSNNGISKESIEDIFNAVNDQRSGATQSTTAAPMAERIIIIDRRGASPPDNNSSSSNTDRYRTIEVRSSTSGTTPSTPSSPAATTTATGATTTTPAKTTTTNTPSNATGFQQPNFYAGQQLYYQQPKMYASTPNMMYNGTTPFAGGFNNFYPYGYYRY